MSKVYAKIIGEEGIYVIDTKELVNENIKLMDNTGYTLWWYTNEIAVLPKKEFPEYYL